MSLKNRIRGYIIEQHHDFGGRLTAKDIISFLEVEKIHYTQRNVKGILQGAQKLIQIMMVNINIMKFVTIVQVN